MAIKLHHLVDKSLAVCALSSALSCRFLCGYSIPQVMLVGCDPHILVELTHNDRSYYRIYTATRMFVVTFLVCVYLCMFLCGLIVHGTKWSFDITQFSVCMNNMNVTYYPTSWLNLVHPQATALLGISSKSIKLLK